MIFLGICHTRVVYESSSMRDGLRLNPTPYLVPIRLVIDGELVELAPSMHGHPGTIFWERDFDPVTKIRRGTIYSMRGVAGQPAEWWVNDPVRQDLGKIITGGSGAVHQVARLVTYQCDSLHELSSKPSTLRSLRVVLGEEPFATFWKVLMVESALHREPLLTLRAMNSLTFLPDLIEANIPKDIRGPIIEMLGKIEAAANRSGPEEIVDLCRNALSIVFGSLSGDRSDDLGAAIASYVSKVNNGKEDLRSWSARIIARLHPRGKPNEQYAKGLTAPTEQYAHFAVQCVGIVLTESGWAK